MSLLCKSAVKQKVLGMMASLRPAIAPKFTRISGDVYAYLENRLLLDIDSLITSHPTTGKTINAKHKGYGT